VTSALELQHVVLFRFPTPLNAAESAEMAAMVRGWPSEIDVIRALRFGPDLTNNRTRGFQYLLMMSFDDQDHLERYRAHPAHLAFGVWIHARNCEVLAFDYYLNEETVFLTPRPTRPEEPALTARSYYRCVDAGDVEGILRLHSPDCVYERPGYLRIVGLPQLRQFYSTDRVIAHGSHQISSLVTFGRSVAVEGEFTGTLKSGVTTAAKFADFFEISDGMIERRRTYFFAPMI